MQQRISHEMALICHVVPLNQDSDTISTVCDEKLANVVADLQAQIRLSSTSSNSTFLKMLKKVEFALVDPLVHGAANDVDSELEQLGKVERWLSEAGFDNVALDVEALNRHLEERMMKHIRASVPDMRRALEGERQRCEEALQAIGSKPTSLAKVSTR